jgi:Na+/H+ antiporter NhaD/arsenite permease-like protein
LFAEVFSSNVGGTATLIGDPPNILMARRPVSASTPFSPIPRRWRL